VASVEKENSDGTMENRLKSNVRRNRSGILLETQGGEIGKEKPGRRVEIIRARSRTLTGGIE